jgi:hypothetical protein
MFQRTTPTGDLPQRMLNSIVKDELQGSTPINTVLEERSLLAMKTGTASWKRERRTPKDKSEPGQNTIGGRD